MAVYLYKWYADTGADGRVIGNGFCKGKCWETPVVRLLRIMTKGLLLEGDWGQRIILVYEEAMDAQPLSWTAKNFLQSRRKMEETLMRSLREDWCRRRFRPDNPLLFYFICMMVREPNPDGRTG